MGLIVDHSVHIGNPRDAELLRPAVARITTNCNSVPMVAADRGYWDATIKTDLTTAGVISVAIPRTGKPSLARQQTEGSNAFVTAVKWRIGSEGRISNLRSRRNQDLVRSRRVRPQPH
jgi:transposase, IS5 family